MASLIPSVNATKIGNNAGLTLIHEEQPVTMSDNRQSGKR